MNGRGRVYVPVFGLTVILTIIAAYNWMAGERGLAETLLWGGVIVWLWILFAVVGRKIKHDSK